MLGLIIPIALAMFLGLAHGGSLSRWAAVQVRWWPLAATCLLVQVALFSPLLETRPAIIVCGPWLYLFSLVGVLAALLANARSGGASRLPLTLAALGIALNCLVIVVNGGYMPRSDDAAASLGMPPIAHLVPARLINVESIGSETRLAWLGDIIPQPNWLPLANVVSVGDLLLSGGLAAWAFQVTTASDGRLFHRPERKPSSAAMQSSPK
jgi:hypothetical protein